MPLVLVSPLQYGGGSATCNLPFFGVFPAPVPLVIFCGPCLKFSGLRSDNLRFILLKLARYRQAKKRRSCDLRYVFSDCKGADVPQVDSMVFRKEAVVESVCEKDCSVTYPIPVAFDETRLLISGNSLHTIVVHCHDHSRLGMSWSRSVSLPQKRTSQRNS